MGEWVWAPKRVAELRAQAGLNRSELGFKLMVGGFAVKNWETGVNRPNAANVARLANALGVTPQDFFVNKEE